MKILLLNGLLCVFAMSAKAQGTGELYAAPGMPLHLQKGVPTVPQRPVKKRTVAEKEAPIPVLSRYWHNPDSLVRKAEHAQLIHYFQRNTAYTEDSLRSHPEEDRIFVTIVLSAEGKVINYEEMISTNNTQSARHRNAAIESLSNNFIRHIRSMRFEPKAGAIDTVTIPMGYFNR